MWGIKQVLVAQFSAHPLLQMYSPNRTTGFTSVNISKDRLHQQAAVSAWVCASAPQPTMITKADERTEDVPSYTRPRSIRHTAPMSPVWRVPSWLNAISCSQGGGRTEGGELEAGRGVRTAGGNCGTERREELNAKMLHNSSLVFPTGGIVIQEIHTTIQYHGLTGSSKRPPPAHIPSHNLKAFFF